MKTISYSCDCRNCNNRTTDLEYNKWIEIGATDSSLFIQNYLKERQIISLNKYESIHFCSKKCLISYFVNSEVEEDNNLKN